MRIGSRWPLRWLALVGSGCGLLFGAQSCGVDPDIFLRAGISFASDSAIFLLENLARGL